MFGGMFGKKKGERSFQEIVDEIDKNLSGVGDRDLKYLHECGDKYKSHPQKLEILRHIGRRISQAMPDDEKQKLQAVFESDLQSLFDTLNSAEALVKAGDIAGALKILAARSLDEGFSEELFPDDDASIYPAFSNPIERSYFGLKFKPTKTMRMAPVPFQKSYQLAAYIAVETKDYDRALRILDKGIKRCPLAADLIFERCEVYKLTKRLPELWKSMMDSSGYFYRKRDIAQYFRNLGWFFTSEKKWDEAIACYGTSMMWQETDMAHRELSYIVSASGRSEDDVLAMLKNVAGWKSILANYSIVLRPTDHKLIQVIEYLAESAENEANYEGAIECYSLYHDLTGSDESAQKLAELSARKN